MTHALQTMALSASLGGREVLNGINLQIAAGRWTCVVGPNGAGKSSLLKALGGLLHTTATCCGVVSHSKSCRAINVHCNCPGLVRAR